ncbi:DUF4179 domain-containing protein [Bacillus sp. SCS-151]|uniref:DUF4179 domain-containing protein n=1 Tax=Nanhaiella sioensis TaxID=3115293 RepID=UPI00397A3B1A
MNCPTTDKLSQYVDQLLLIQEHTTIQHHLKDCVHCQHVVNAFQDEQRFIKETLQTPTLPDQFASTVLDQLEPYKQKVTRKKRSTKKRIMLTVAGIILTVSLSAVLQPSFAQLIGGLFSTNQVDDGLRMASQAGVGERVNLEVTDQNITFKVEDVIADPSRLAISYQLVNEHGKIIDYDIDWSVHPKDMDNDISAIIQNGKIIPMERKSWMKREDDYGFIEFPLREYEELGEAFTLVFNISNINGVKGNWQLDVPVDLTRSLQLTHTLPLNDVSTTYNGVMITMKETRYAPSSYELLYETSFTEEELAKVEENIQNFEEQYGEGIISDLTLYGSDVNYHLENEEHNNIHENDRTYHDTIFQDNSIDSNFHSLGTSNEDLALLGHNAWSTFFTPLGEDEKLTFVLDGVAKTAPSDFSIIINPKELKKNPVTFEYEGNYMTITKAKKRNEYSLRKAIIPIEIETNFTIEMEGGKDELASEFVHWIIEDDNGNVYPTFDTKSILNKKDKNDRYKTSIDIRAYDIEEIPEEFTLHLLSVKRFYELDKQWQVPLYQIGE